MVVQQLTNIIRNVDVKSFKGAKEESFEAGVVLALFLQSVVSNVSSKCLPEHKHNHIGCNYAISLQSEFSSVFLNRLHE